VGKSATKDAGVPQLFPGREFDADVGEHFAELAAGLRHEVETYLDRSDLLGQLLTDIDRFEDTCRLAPPQLNYTGWRRMLEDYRRLVHRKASLANELSRIACSYASMDEFWRDAEAQERGESSHTFWDTYEHGRRRQLEEVLAQTYGSSSALLLNSGMSGIAVVTGMLNLRAGERILTGNRCYFETSDYLARFVSQTGVDIIRVPVDEPGSITRALKQLQPAMAIFETVTNTPDVPIARGFNDWLAAAPKTFFLIDNSVQSHLTRWFEILGENPRLLVIESATKYLTEECMAGVLYGHPDAVEKARNYARSTGQQLQEKAFNYLTEAGVKFVGRKLAWHSRNVAVINEELKSFASLFSFSRTLDNTAGNEPELEVIFRHGRGGLIFAALKVPGSDGGRLAELHRRLLARWRELTIEMGLELQIRAGFGWNQTSARAYESERLNQPDAPCFIRISVGTEPVAVARTLARALGQAAREVSETTPKGAAI
jgi:cystathionine beta-lyase/cystathionine gamma-synthase